MNHTKIILSKETSPRFDKIQKIKIQINYKDQKNDMTCHFSKIRKMTCHVEYKIFERFLTSHCLDARFLSFLDFRSVLRLSNGSLSTILQDLTRFPLCLPSVLPLTGTIHL